MKSEEIKELFKQFESIVCEYNKVECWSARELYPLLGYSQSLKPLLTRTSNKRSSAEKRP